MSSVTSPKIASTSAAQSARRRALDALLAWPGILLFWTAWGGAHALVRWSESSALVPDEARSAQLVQYFSWGYSVRQPPDYPWLLWLTQQLIGSNLFSNIALRYAVAASIGLAAYAAARAATDDRRCAAAASLSLIFIPHVGWTVHTMLTDTLLISLACFLSFASLVDFIRRPTLGAAAALGLALALGMLAKWNFILFATGLGVAAASLPEARSSLRDPRLLAAAALLLLCMAPYLHWIMTRSHDPLSTAEGGLFFSAGRSHLMGVATGLAKLPVAIVQFLLPWLVLAGTVAWARRDQWRSLPPGTLGERLAWRTIAAAVAITLVGIVLTGATYIADRYMHPLVLLTPVAFFSTLARTSPSQDLMRGITTACAALTGAILVIMLATPLAAGLPVWRLFHLWPYDGLATALQGRGLAAATFVTADEETAGNVRVFLPQARVIDLRTDPTIRPPATAANLARCVAISWHLAPDAALPQFVPDLASRPRELIRVAWRRPPFGERRFGAWDLIALDPSLPICR